MFVILKEVRSYTSVQSGTIERTNGIVTLKGTRDLTRCKPPMIVCIMVRFTILIRSEGSLVGAAFNILLNIIIAPKVSWIVSIAHNAESISP